MTTSKRIGKVKPPTPKKIVTLTNNQLVTIITALEHDRDHLQYEDEMSDEHKSWQRDNIDRALKAVTK